MLVRNISDLGYKDTHLLDIMIYCLCFHLKDILCTTLVCRETNKNTNDLLFIANPRGTQLILKHKKVYVPKFLLHPRIHCYLFCCFSVTIYVFNLVD